MNHHLFYRWTFLMLGALWVVCSGCASSPPVRFYTLSPSVPAGPETNPSGNKACLSLGIGPIKFPDYLDQPKIVTRMTPYEIQMAEYDRWAEGLKDNFTRVLGKNLSALVCTRNILVFPWRGGAPIDYRVEMEVLRLDGGLGGEVTLEAWWMVLSGDGKKTVLSRRSTFTEAVGGKDYPSLVASQSRTVGLLSSEIAEAIKTLPK